MTRVLTGIQATGKPHVGNLAGAIRPALTLATEADEAMYFIADYHALTTVHDRQKLATYTREVAATWIAMGLDPTKVTFYRQSDVPEVFELAWVLACFTPKGWMNKAHAYKAAVDRNSAAGVEDADAGIGMGLFNYPILMAADILAFDVDLVPVGEDQRQHLEIARDIAQRINHEYGTEVLRLPNARIDKQTAVVPGLDGRKMSKSYGNTIPVFATAKELEKLVKSIKTDSTPPEVPKDPETSTIFQIFRAIATPAESAAFADEYRAGIGWGRAKQALAERLEAELREPRRRYDELIADPTRLDTLLAEGAAKARGLARVVLDRTRRAIGIAT